MYSSTKARLLLPISGPPLQTVMGVMHMPAAVRANLMAAVGLGKKGESLVFGADELGEGFQGRSGSRSSWAHQILSPKTPPQNIPLVLLSQQLLTFFVPWNIS